MTATAVKPKTCEVPCNDSRDKEQRRRPLPYIHHPSFSLSNTEETLWGEQREEIPVRDYTLLPQMEEHPTNISTKHNYLSPEEERILFLRYNYAKYRLNRLPEEPRNPDQAVQVELWTRRAQDVREKIIHANLPLAPAIARKKRVVGVMFSDKISEAYLAILRSVEHFDVSRGYKFSTYACRSILACLCRLGTKVQRYHQHVCASFQPSMEPDDADERRRWKEQSDAVESVRKVLLRNEADLNSVQQDVIRRRYPLDETQSAEPLWKIGRHLGVSTERARQIEKASLQKLQEALDKEMVA